MKAKHIYEHLKLKTLETKKSGKTGLFIKKDETMVMDKPLAFVLWYWSHDRKIVFHH